MTAQELIETLKTIAHTMGVSLDQLEVVFRDYEWNVNDFIGYTTYDENTIMFTCD